MYLGLIGIDLVLLVHYLQRKTILNLIIQEYGDKDRSFEALVA